MPTERTTIQLSIVSPTGYSTYTCGYCKPPGSGKRSSRKSRKSYGIWAHRLSPYHYQALIDQGWRRSGDYIYKPDLLRTCCAQIPIRLPVHDFKPAKGHKRALTNLLFRVRQTKQKPAKWKGKWSTGRDWDVEQRLDEIVTKQDSSTSALPSSSTAWADRVAGPITRKLQVQLTLASTTDEKYQLFRKYQASVHGESEDGISSKKGFSRFLVDSSLALSWPSTGKPLTPSQESQWRAKKLDAACLPDELPYGNYHQEYRLDGKLIAVGVLDILPHCVSSVYVFYDPEYNDWELGKVTALQEIALTKRLGRLRAMSDITSYYMGFYIHTCQKMKYKAEYRPSQLLDCGDNTWHNIVDVASSLDAKQFFGWSDTQQQLRQASDNIDKVEEESHDKEERAVRVPTEPRPPPGMLNAPAILRALQQMLRGIEASELESDLNLLQEAMILEAQNQAAGIKPLLGSNIFRAYVQDSQQEQEPDEDEGSELVQVVECIAALSNPELVAQTVLFI
ncbi:hypothetical protein NDA16_003874 [Ustilago loliicola]|nr:hypothetical protein NDA16_003874 [Ustilago loliicola]